MERAALERRYKEKMEPLFVERRGVVCGDFDEAIAKETSAVGVVGGSGEESGAEVAEGEVEDVVSDNDGEEGDEVGDEVVKGIPQFWACAMGHVDVIAELITEGTYLYVLTIGIA